MKKILLICGKEYASLFTEQKGFEVKTFTEFNSLLLKMFSYDFILIADLEEEKEFPHMEYSEAGRIMNCLAINDVENRGIYTMKDLKEGVSVVDHSIALLNEQKINLEVTV